MTGITDRSQPSSAQVVWHVLRLNRMPGEAGRSRDFTRHVLTAPNCPAAVDDRRLGDVLLVVSELVTNTLEHTHECPTLALGLTPDTVKVEVRDDDPTRPVCQRPSPGRPHGHGLAMIARLAHGRHGTRPLPGGGKAVWADLTLRDG